MLRLMMLLSIFSLFLIGCAQALKRPDADALVVNAQAKHLYGYNLSRDYDDQGVRLPNAKPTIFPAGILSDINGWVCTDPKGFTNIKVSVADARAYISKHCVCK